MVSLDKAVVARYKHGKKNFEILVDPELAYRIRSEGKGEVEPALAADEIFKNVSKGEKATDGD